MNVGQLRRVLMGFEDDKPVFMSIDEEGNAFHPVGEVQMGGHDETLDGAAYPLVLWPGWPRLDMEFTEED